MLKIRNLAKTFDAGARTVLREVSLDVRESEYIAVVGESGSGKSTLLNLIAGLEAPDSGRIELDGEDLTRLDDDARTRLRRARMGFVFQAFHLLPHLTVERNVALPLALNGIAGTQAERRVAELLSAVGLAHRRHESPARLSGGEMQRVAVARALVHRPRLVLADEPTGNLDGNNARQVFDLMLELNRELGTALVIVTHAPELAQRMQRILTLTEGRLV